MRVSDDRYSRDRLRLDLALRFIRHEARTHTIRAWTGLTDDRIRKLYRTYLHEAGNERVARHRGKSPQQAAFFLRAPRMQMESAVLASMYCMMRVLPRTPHREFARTLPCVARGELLCHAYDAYRTVIPDGRITFEHAVFLVTALATGDELLLERCECCGALTVTDRFAMQAPRCRQCVSDPGAGPLLQERAMPAGARGTPAPAQLRR